MCIHKCESNSELMQAHNNNLRAAAAVRLGDLAKKGTHRRADAAFNRKAGARLKARVADWKKSIDDPANRGKDMSGYHMPGSMQKVC